jgi:tellurite resistance protein
MAWGVALACFLWVATQGQRIVSQAFSVGHWAVSFPLAAFAGLTLELGRHGSGGPMPVLGPLLLAFASVIVLGLSMGTVRGLRQRTLLAPEPVATITPISG